MSLTIKIIFSLLIAAAIASATTLIQGNTLPDVPMLMACGLSALASIILVSLPEPKPAGNTSTGGGTATKASGHTPRQETNREFGEVKWFNASKGFGFIIKEDGEEIFVHFRSIRGEGRRGLRDGQQVSFVVTDSDKGPQAEDVEPEA